MNDDHGQPINHGLNQHRNTQRTIDTLIGIVTGLVADQQLNEPELHMLENWLSNHSHANGDPDFFDIQETITDIIADGIITAEELEDLHDQLSATVKYRADLDDSSANQLIAITLGLTADNVLNDLEITYLRDWLNNTPGTLEWPLNVIATQVNAVLADGVITELERQSLLTTLTRLHGSHWMETGAASGLATRLPTEEIGHIDFSASTFCFTGQFLTQTRKQIEDVAIAFGGTISKSITQDVNYLVIGTLASRDWVGTSHGRKIERAVLNRDAGHPIAIIAEEHWAAHLPAK